MEIQIIDDILYQPLLFEHFKSFCRTVSLIFTALKLFWLVNILYQEKIKLGYASKIKILHFMMPYKNMKNSGNVRPWHLC